MNKGKEGKQFCLIELKVSLNPNQPTNQPTNVNIIIIERNDYGGVLSEDCEDTAKNKS